MATLREKQKVQQWQLKAKHLVQTVLRIKFLRKKLRVNAGYVNNVKKLSTT
jgi:hypothetical protein